MMPSSNRERQPNKSHRKNYRSKSFHSHHDLRTKLVEKRGYSETTESEDEEIQRKQRRFSVSDHNQCEAFHATQKCKLGQDEANSDHDQRIFSDEEQSGYEGQHTSFVYYTRDLEEEPQHKRQIINDLKAELEYKNGIVGDLEAKLEDNNQLVTEWETSRTNDNNQIKFMKRKINELMSQLEVARNIKKYHAEQNEKEIERQREFSEKLESELNETKTK